jgi:hypothetical protein
MARTTLRICEALALSCADVDVAGGLLIVRVGKRDRTRLVPPHPGVVAAPSDYAASGCAFTIRRTLARRSSGPIAATGSATAPPTTPSPCCASGWAEARSAAPAPRACGTADALLEHPDGQVIHLRRMQPGDLFR